MEAIKSAVVYRMYAVPMHKPAQSIISASIPAFVQPRSPSETKPATSTVRRQVLQDPCSSKRSSHNSRRHRLAGLTYAASRRRNYISSTPSWSTINHTARQPQGRSCHQPNCRPKQRQQTQAALRRAEGTRLSSQLNTSSSDRQLPFRRIATEPTGRLKPFTISFSAEASSAP